VHQGHAKIPLPELRQRYDGLVLKVLALLQDGDPPLATAILSSREAIWAFFRIRRSSHRSDFRMAGEIMSQRRFVYAGMAIAAVGNAPLIQAADASWDKT